MNNHDSIILIFEALASRLEGTVLLFEPSSNHILACSVNRKDFEPCTFTRYFEKYKVLPFKVSDDNQPAKGDIVDRDKYVVGYWEKTIVGEYHLVSFSTKDKSNETLLSILRPYMRLIENMDGIIFVKDVAGSYVAFSKGCMEKSEYINPDQVIGYTDMDLWPENAHMFIKNDQEVITSKQSKFFIERFIYKDGLIRYYAGYKSAILDQNDNVIGVFGNLQDITILKQREHALVDEKDSAVKQNQAKLQFIRNMQHDIRTPFSGILGMANLLYEQETDTEKKAMISTLTTSAEELLNYCNDIIDYANIENGQIAVIDRLFDFKKLARSVYNLEMPAAKNKNVELSFEYDDALAENLVGDPFRLQRILINLVGNAIKFTEKGAVKFKISKIREYKHQRSLIVSMRVEDTGIGIPESQQDMIFEKMTRVSPSNKGLYRGHGFGLKIVRQFTQELDGDLNLESTCGQGTAVTVVVPLRMPLVQDAIY